jgi:predicted Zn-dependent peptidase
MEHAKLSRLKNGLAVITDRIQSVETILAGVWVAAGSADETAANSGAAHFVEHMLFKGTERRTYRRIAEEIEDAGGEMNAYTSKEHTFFWVRLLKEHLELGIDILADIIQNSLIDEGETAKERVVIEQELLSSLDDPEDLVHNMFDTAAYPGQPMGMPVIGRLETVRAMTPAKLRAYMRRNYSADRMQLVISGNFEHDKALRLAEKHFGRIGAGAVSRRKPAKYSGGEGMREAKLEHVHIVLGFEGAKVSDRREAFAEGLLSSALGGSMSSRLFQEIRERRNLAYSIQSGAHGFSNTGIFQIHTSTEPGRANAALDAIAEEIKKALDGGITEAELARAKAGFKSDLAMQLESTRMRARMLGHSYQHFGRLIGLGESAALVESIGRADILAAALRVFGTPPTLAAAGKTRGLRGAEQIGSMLSK